jgi:hypothetical protein
MPHYISLHSLACLTRQGAQQLLERFQKAPGIAVQRTLVNMQEGKMLVEWEAPERETLERWLAAEKVHFDWLLRVEYEAREGPLEPAS